MPDQSLTIDTKPHAESKQGVALRLMTFIFNTVPINNEKNDILKLYRECLYVVSNPTGSEDNPLST